MALQGTLDTFALADLIRLLATTTKTGELAIDGDRGTGRLWFLDGDLVGGHPAPDGSAEDALFELLRFQEGEFHFAADAAAEDAHEPANALDVLEAAEARLAEWLPIAALVPSERVSLRLAERLGHDEVLVTRETWEQLLLVAPGTTAGAFGAALGLGEVAAATAVRDLSEMGLVEIGPEVDDAVAPEVEEIAEADPVEEVAEVEEVEEVDEVDEVDAEAAHHAEAEAVEASDHPESLDALLAPAEDLPAVERDGTEPLEALVETPSWVPWGEPVAFAEEIDAPSSSLSAATLAAIDEVLPMEEGPAPMFDAALPTLDEAPIDALDGGDEVHGHEVHDDVLAEDEDEHRSAVEDADVLAALDMLPPVASAPRPVEPVEAGGDLAVDLDAHLGGATDDHRYLGGEPGATALPEPLPLVEPMPVEVDEAVSAAPEASAAPAPEPAPARRNDPVMEGWPGTDAREQELAMQLDALSPAAARAVASAASSGTTAGDSEAGRRVLRRIISSGRG